jgi:PleD family two-component response regulator
LGETVITKREATTNTYAEDESSKYVESRRPSLLTKTVRILIVDDDDDITTTLRMGLESNDKTFQIYACNDPLELL